MLVATPLANVTPTAVPEALGANYAEHFPEIKLGDWYETLPGARYERPLGLPGSISYPGHGVITEIDASTMNWHEHRDSWLAGFDGVMTTKLDGDVMHVGMQGKLLGFVPFKVGLDYRITDVRRGRIEMQLEGGRGRTSVMSLEPLGDGSGVSRMHFELEQPLGGLVVEDGLIGPKDAVKAALAAQRTQT